MKYKGVHEQQINFELFHGIAFANIALLLLLFFMLYSSLSGTLGITLKFPRFLTSQDMPQQMFTLAISANGKIFALNKFVDSDTLERMIKTGHYTAVFIKADSKTSLAALTAVWEICKKAGVERIGIATGK
ncbi:MAG: biopolymer transporter ExbD [Candidatus Omnitrophota bacterium]